MKPILQSCLMLIVMTLICGVLYPALITGIGQVLWPHESSGSLIRKEGIVVGSELISQKFSSKKYFWPRPSARDGETLPASASNLGPTNAALAQFIDKRRTLLSTAHGIRREDIPLDLLTTSASGLDPHISYDAARIQVERIAKARGLDNSGGEKIKQLIDEHLENPQMGILGEKRINVLLLNLRLDVLVK